MSLTITRAVLRMLRADSRRWWYHSQLRDHGRTTEAVQLEKRSVRQSLKSIREAVFVSVHEGRYRFYAEMGAGGSLSGYDQRGDGWPGAAELAGIPTVVASDVPEEKRVSFALRMPLVGLSDGKTLQDVLKHAREYGARVLNV